MWCIPCLMMAGGLLAGDRLGGGGTLEQWMQQLAGNSGFVQAALSSEIGAPGWESVSEHAPQAVGVSEIVAAQALPENMTDGESCDTDASAVRVSESLFALRTMCKRR